MDGITPRFWGSSTSFRPSAAIVPPSLPRLSRDLPVSLRRPSVVLRFLASQNEIVTTWAPILARRRKILLANLLSLSLDDLLMEIAIEQWAIIMERAEGVISTPEKERNRTMLRLQRSESESDRYVAMLASRWMKKRG